MYRADSVFSMTLSRSSRVSAPLVLPTSQRFVLFLNNNLVEKSDCVIYARSLCGIAFKMKILSNHTVERSSVSIYCLGSFFPLYFYPLLSYAQVGTLFGNISAIIERLLYLPGKTFYMGCKPRLFGF